MDSRSNQTVRKLLQLSKGRDDGDLVWTVIVQTNKGTDLVISGYGDHQQELLMDRV